MPRRVAAVDGTAVDEELRLERELGIERARGSLLGFIRHVTPTFRVNWHHRAICDLADRVVAGEVPRAIVNIAPRHGKALAVRTPVATTKGWREVGDLMPGDCVFDLFGRPTEVWTSSRIFRNRPVCAVEANGDVVCADAEHVWPVVAERGTGPYALMTTRDLLALPERHVAALAGERVSVTPQSVYMTWRRGARLRVRAAGVADTVCIQVGHPSGIFRVGHSYMPTHNSEIISRHLPAYFLGREPDRSIIACSYGADLAQRMNRDCQRIIDSDRYAEVFPHTRLSSANIRTVAHGSWLRNADMFEVVGRRGMYRAAGVGGGVTGLGADLIVLDDLLKNAEEAGSETVLEKHWEWYQTTLRTRLAKGGRILLIATRWCDGDVPGRLVAQSKLVPNGDQWQVLNLPAVNVAGPTDIDPRQPGEALWPEFFPTEELAKIRASSERAWQAMYQGDPVPPGGSLVKAVWWRRWTRATLPNRFERLIISCDLTFKDRGDYTVFEVWGRMGGDAYLLDQVRGKMGFTAQCTALEELWARHPGVREVLVEDAANGAALVATLRSRIPGLMPVSPKGSSKLARAEAVAHVIESGHAHIPASTEAGWTDEFVHEWTRFPFGAHDDQVDCATYALARLFPPRAMHAMALPVSMTKTSAWRT